MKPIQFSYVSVVHALAACLLGASTASHACDDLLPTRPFNPGPHDYTAASADPRMWHEGDPGEPLFLRARVLDTCGKPVTGARVQILHANHDGYHEPDRWRADLRTDEQGAFKIVTVYPGYAGDIARHVHFIITHANYQPLVTRLYFKNDPAVGPDVDDLAVVAEEITRGEGKTRGWAVGYEFVLVPG